MSDTEQPPGSDDTLSLVGQIALELIHDLRTPLTALSISTAMLHKHLQAGQALEGASLDEARTLASEALSSLEYAHRIVNDVRLASHHAAAASPIDVDEEVTAACRLAEPVLRDVAQFVHRLGVDQREPAMTVMSVPGELCRLTLNLILNAADSIDGGAFHDNEVRVVTRLQDDNAMIVVSDTGDGIDDAERAMIFEPFYTTKPREQNAGLGLAGVRRIAESVGASIDVQSREGVGSTFTVRIPLSTSERAC